MDKKDETISIRVSCRGKAQCQGRILCRGDKELWTKFVNKVREKRPKERVWDILEKWINEYLKEKK